MTDRQELEDQLQRVPAFRGRAMFLSNYHSVSLEFNHAKFWSLEQLYHYLKCATESDRQLILFSDHKSLAPNSKRVNLRPDWLAVREGYMLELLRFKFHQGGEELARKLVETDGLELVERNNWGETTWGVNQQGKGKNLLGKGLTKVRSELKAEFEAGTFTTDYTPAVKVWDGHWQ